MACGDVLSLEDLQTAKKHQIFEAEVITGKAGGVAGGDYITTATNQATGQVQTTLPETLRQVGFKPASFTFATGGTLQPGDNDLAVHNPAPAGDGNYYSWGGALPKVVAAGSTPATSGGLGSNAWVPRTDAVLRSDLALPSGSSMVGFQQAGAGSVPRTSEDKMRDRVSVMDFGPVGDGITDDTAAVLSAINYVKGTGKELDWHDRTYRVTSTLDITFSSVMRWVSSGAKILYDPPAGTYAALRLQLITGGNYIKGHFTVDANRKAHVGLRGRPTVDITEEPDLLLEDTEVINVFRAGTTFNDGDGMIIAGTFGRVHLIRPKVKDCHMAVGAGIKGTYGICGITITRSNPSTQNNCPKYVVIEDPWVENVWSDDPAYMDDQDGIKVFTRYGGTATGGKNNPNTFDLRGGRVINVRGRSIKGQTEAGRISGVKLYRTTLANNGVSAAWTLNADIEMQTGGCTISDIEFQYEGFAHARIARVIQADDTVPYASPNVIDGIRGVVTGIAGLAAIVTVSGNDGGVSTDMSATISNLNVESDTTAFNSGIAINSTSNEARIFVTASNIIGKFSTDIFSAANNAIVEVFANNIVNRGPAVPLSTGFFSATERITASNLYGITGYPTTTYGISSPEGVVTASVGSQFHRLNGSAGTSLYIKESGTGNTGWVAK